MSRLKASEGQWYSDLSTREVFCVIRVDDADGIIDVRDGYGDIDEFDFDEWDHMDLQICAAPTGWMTDDDDDDDLEETPREARKRDSEETDADAQQPAAAVRRR